MAHVSKKYEQIYPTSIDNVCQSHALLHFYKKAEMFFFAKKNQKTFASLQAHRKISSFATFGGGALDQHVEGRRVGAQHQAGITVDHA